MRRIIFAIAIASVVDYGHGYGKEPEPSLTAAALAALKKHVDILVPPESEVLETCYEGYTLSEQGECTKEINEPATLVCPIGNLINGACQIIAPFLSRCVVGYQPTEAGDQCIRSWEVPYQFYCPKGYFDNGISCGKTEPSSVVSECDYGDLIGDNCISYKQLPYEISSTCPDGAEVEEDGNCWKVVDTFECGRVVPEAKVITSLRHQSPVLGKDVSAPVSAKEHIRILAGKKNVQSEVTSFIVAEPVKEMISVTAPEAIKIDVSTSLCRKKVLVNAIAVMSCPSGYDDNGSACIQQLVTPPRMTCLSTGHTEGPCPPLVRHAPKKPGCPKDADRINDKCVMHEYTLPERDCARGFIPVGDVCVGEIESPGFECPTGLLLEGDRCIGQFIRPPVVINLEPETPCEKSKKY